MLKQGKTRGMTRRNMNDHAKRGLVLNSPTKENGDANQTSVVVSTKAAPITVQTSTSVETAVVAAAETAIALDAVAVELQKKVNDLDGELRASKKAKAELEVAKSQIELEKIRLEESLNSTQTEKTAAQSELALLQQTHAAMVQAHKALTEKHEKVEAHDAHLEKELRQVTAELNEVASARMTLESRVEALQFENATLTANFSSYKTTKAQVEAGLEAQVESLKKAAAEARAQIEHLIQQHEQALDNEKKKYSIVATEHEQLRKDAESKSRKLERVEEFVSITKEMNVSLQSERDQLKEQLKAEKETTTRLHALVAASHNDSTSLERQVHSAESQIKATASQLYKVHTQLFFNMGLALKLDRLHTYGQICNISLQKLWDDVQTLGIDPNQWSVFINAALAAAAKETSLVIN
jgi:chromosome segregation ATPase